MHISGCAYENNRVERTKTVELRFNQNFRKSSVRCGRTKINPIRTGPFLFFSYPFFSSPSSKSHNLLNFPSTQLNEGLFLRDILYFLIVPFTVLYNLLGNHKKKFVRKIRKKNNAWVGFSFTEFIAWYKWLESLFCGSIQFRRYQICIVLMLHYF